MLINSPRDLAIMVVNQRKKLKLSQAKVGDLIGLRQATVALFENKPESTKLETLFQILSAVNLNLEITPKNDSSKTNDKWEAEW